MFINWQRITCHFRFRTSSLLWLVVVVTAFFAGRQSEEIAGRLWQAWAAVWPGSAPYRLASQPDGSILLTSSLRIPRVQVSDAQVCAVEPIDANRIRIFAKKSGDVIVNFWVDNGQSWSSGPQISLAFKAENGQLRHRKFAGDVPMIDRSNRAAAARRDAERIGPLPGFDDSVNITVD